MNCLESLMFMNNNLFSNEFLKKSSHENQWKLIEEFKNNRYTLK